MIWEELRKAVLQINLCTINPTHNWTNLLSAVCKMAYSILDLSETSSKLLERHYAMLLSFIPTKCCMIYVDVMVPCPYADCMFHFMRISIMTIMHVTQGLRTGRWSKWCIWFSRVCIIIYLYHLRQWWFQSLLAPLVDDPSVHPAY